MFHNLNDAQKIFLIRVFGTIGIIVFFLFALLIGHQHEINCYNESQQDKKNEQIVSAHYVRKQTKLQNQIIKKSDTSNDPVLRSIGQNHDAIDAISNPIIKFAKVYYNWNGERKYQLRAHSLNGTLSPNLLKNRALFGSDHNQISKNSLNCVLNNLSISQLSRNGNNVNVLADAYYTSWNADNDKNASSSDQAQGADSKKNGSQWILFSVNTKTHQIDGIKMIFLNPNAHHNANNDDDGNDSDEAGSGVQY